MTVNERIMHRTGWAFSADWEKILGLPLAILGLMLMAAGDASARQCPRGEIWRVSKNICAPRGEKFGALKANSYAPTSELIDGRVFYGPTVGAKPSRGPEPEIADTAPSGTATDMETPATYVVAKRPKPPVSAPQPSPYGALSLDSFAKP